MGALVKIRDARMGVFSGTERERLLIEKERAWQKVLEKAVKNPPHPPKPLSKPGWVKYWYQKCDGQLCRWVFKWVWKS